METISEKLDYIIKEINLTPNYIKQIKEAKREKIDYYTSNKLELKNIDGKKILKHNFQSEVIARAEQIEKLETFEALYDNDIIGLEKHIFAPELNKLLISNYPQTIEIPTPQQTTISEAKKYIRDNYALFQIRQFRNL